jgi:hypothetical protein
MPLLNVFGELESFTSDLYPYRFVITPLLLAALAGALYTTYRFGLHQVLLRHRVATVAVGAPLLALSLVAGDYLLSPLWERSYLEEASPLDAVSQPPAASGDAMPVSMPGAAAEVSAGVRVQGMFMGADDFHFGRGDAQIIRTAEGSHVLRFENFSVRNGPDLYVYLSVDEDGKKVEEALNLGRLKATDGAFNYEIPAHINLESIQSVIVWCRQFSTLFAVASLS